MFRPMEQELISNLSAVFAAFKTVSRLEPSTIWMRAVGDARFMRRISAGSGFTVRTYDRALNWFSDNWPCGAEWPAGVARPVVQSEAAQ
jgi:hypothetical protein